MGDPTWPRRSERSAQDWATSLGPVFQRFTEATQDSGNLAYGVRVGDERYFIKTAGTETSGPARLSQRVGWLRDAAAMHSWVQHRALPPLLAVVDTETGPALVYPWLDAVQLRGKEAILNRFWRRPLAERRAAAEELLTLHAALAEEDYVAVDLYDGCLMYDFAACRLYVIDLDMYRRGAFRNDMGRMYGSGRFMPPEQLALGARVDHRSTVFLLGRLLAHLIPEPGAGLAAVIERACAEEPEARYQEPAALLRAFRATAT